MHIQDVGVSCEKKLASILKHVEVTTYVECGKKSCENEMRGVYSVNTKKKHIFFLEEIYVDFSFSN